MDNNDDGKEGLEEAMRYRSFLIYIYAYMIIYVYIFILEYFYEIKYYHCPYTDLVGNNKPNFGCDLFTIDVLTWSIVIACACDVKKLLVFVVLLWSNSTGTMYSSHFLTRFN